MNTLTLFKKRRSVQVYLPKKVPNKVLFRVFEAVRWAPSAHNAQPWRFIVIRDSVVKVKLAKAMGRRWNKDMRGDGVPQKSRETLVRASVERFTSAPIVTIACLTMEEMDKYPNKGRQRIEKVMGIQSVAAAIENMLLAAHAEGLGSCWFCTPLFCPDVLRKVLGIPSPVEPEALITLGYPAEKPKAPPRKPLENIMYRDRWGQIP